MAESVTPTPASSWNRVLEKELKAFCPFAHDAYTRGARCLMLVWYGLPHSKRGQWVWRLYEGQFVIETPGNPASPPFVWASREN